MSSHSTMLNNPSSAISVESSVQIPFGRRMWLLWGLLAVAAAVVGYLYAESLRFLLQAWFEDDNYSHAPFIPLISLYLVWVRWNRVQADEPQGQWWGVPIIAAGLCIYVVGQFAAMHAIVHLSLWLVLVGLVACVVGMSGVVLSVFPLFYLLAAIPLPEFLHGELSNRLQLWSSALGVGCLQFIGVMASREGNVIDLGPIQLQVVEACSGLRYLFPLTALTLLCAYLYRECFWKRAVLFLSSIPISILLNGFRIGAIGLLVESYGRGAAQGFSHFFEGWVFFVASLGLLCAEMWVLARAGSTAPPRPFADLVGLPSEAGARPDAPAAAAHKRAFGFHIPLVAGIVLLAVTALAAPMMAPQEFPSPARSSLLEFPLQVGEWQGVSVAMERQYLDALQLDDYVLAEYTAPNSAGPVNVYVAYYASPKKGRSSHSPRQCIPGGGWEITSFEPVPVKMSRLAGEPIAFDANRVVIQKGGQKQIVYYWFKQRDRWITSEYAVKFFLFWDSLTRHRADGALVRLVSSIHAGETEATVDQRLQAMAGIVTPMLSRYVPD